MLVPATIANVPDIFLLFYYLLYFFQIITRFFANIAAAAVTAMSIWVIIGGGVGGIVLFVIFGIILWKVSYMLYSCFVVGFYLMSSLKLEPHVDLCCFLLMSCLSHSTEFRNKSPFYTDA